MIGGFIEVWTRQIPLVVPAKAGIHDPIASNFSSNRMAQAHAAEQWSPAFAGEAFR
jgi:hypothetical protein